MIFRRPADHSSKLARGELADGDATEQLAAEHPDELLRRRDFLARTAALAGTASLASLLPADRLIAEAARLQAQALPSPRNMPLDTIVVLMMENRSFDHYFGWREDVDGRNTGLSYVDGEGRTVKTHRLTPDYQGCGHPDPDHSWDGGRFQWNRGEMDGFAKGNEEGDGSDEFACGYYLKPDLGFIPHAAGQYTIFDRYFHSLMASTYPNRHYQWSAQSGGNKNNVIPLRELGHDWETIADRAISSGVSFTYYNSDLPFAALYGPRAIPWVKPVSAFYLQAATGTLPKICFVDPPFTNGGGGDGMSADEHPHGDIRLGQAFMSDIVHAFIDSPQYKRGALFINYDEWGGFFEHVQPRFVPDGRRSRDLYEDFGMTGFRTPGVVVSPFTRGHHVSHQFVTHESILKLISYRWGLGYLNRRHRYATNIGRSFNWDNPVYARPDLPDPQAVITAPCTVREAVPGEELSRPKPHDMLELQTSGYLDAVGFDAPAPTLEQIFREPDRVRQALESTR